MLHELDQHCYPQARPSVTTDVVIFTVVDQTLTVMLLERSRDPFKGLWALPGGFVAIDENLRQSAERKLKEETGVEGVFLEQLYTFGTLDRDPRERVISVAYYALIPFIEMDITSDDVKWFALRDLPKLAFDHSKIIIKAHERLVAKLDYSTIAFQFMPREFTLSELQDVYELIVNQELDKRNFRKRILSLGVIKETGKLKKVGAHRPAKLYKVQDPSRVRIIK